MTDETPEGTPPKGFRKAIPWPIKCEVIIQQEGKCKACGNRLWNLKTTEFDHNPALQLRWFDIDSCDTQPGANDPEYIEAKHKDCHAAKTFGGSSPGLRRGDVTEIAKVRRISKEHQEFRRRLTSVEKREKPPSKWPKRPWPKKRETT